MIAPWQHGTRNAEPRETGAFGVAILPDRKACV